jgi:hypothetical protein
MAIHVQIDERTSQAKVQLVLPDDIHDGPVSVVGSFNEWTPGRHKLVRRNNGTRSVTLRVPPGEDCASATSAPVVAGSTTRMHMVSTTRAESSASRRRSSS